jgi:YcxB-like protein
MPGKNFSHVAWENVRKAVERPRYFRFDLNQYESVIIPKRFLSHGADEQVLREIIASTVEPKAKLLG